MIQHILRITLVVLFFTSCLQDELHAQVYISPTGSDAQAGTREAPMLSLGMALRKVREMRRLHDTAIAGGIEIIVQNGRYQLDEPIFIRPEDSGTEDSPTTIRAAEGAKPVFSGGIAVKGWKKVTGNVARLPKQSNGKIWVTDAPLIGGRLLEFRQLWVNGQKAIRAKERNGDSMSRILSWDHKAEECWIPKPEKTDVSGAEGLEMVIHQWWAIAILRVKEAKAVGDRVRLSFHQPESRIQSEHPWPAPWISSETGNSAFYLVNAIQFLDEPGEWFLDMKAGKLYYYPKPGENLPTATVIVPRLETLVRIEGTTDHPVSHVYFKAISFAHTSWLRPSREGHVPHQAGMYMLDAYKLHTPGTRDKRTLENQAWVGRPAAAVKVEYASNTGFQSCRFERLASTGLDYNKGTHHNVIKGNIFKDIGGSAIIAGLYSDEASEVHLPYNPDDEREICTDMVISNNLVNNVTNEDWGTVGIGAGYVRNITIEHNDISEISYTGISLGWGWTPVINAMRNNRIVANNIHQYAKHMYDVAGIYTLSAQPGSEISGNRIDSAFKAPYAHLPSHWFYLYSDEGSSYITIKNNWTPSRKYLQNANGPGNTWINNGPQVHDSIKASAGLQASYRHLLSERDIDRNRPVVKDHPIVIEMTGNDVTEMDIRRVKAVLAANGADSSELYRWQNHLVYFGKVSDVSVLTGKLRNAIDNVAVKVYHDLFYEFNRGMCNETVKDEKWTHTILTANLVKNDKLQREYFEHHATQLQKWPEVARGFCNAGFTQLLLFRNGRQLMLVISVPEGKSLDALNPKTTENNPRMDDWNTMMKKYQEGIAGTKPGEVWVFFEPVNETNIK